MFELRFARPRLTAIAIVLFTGSLAAQNSIPLRQLGPAVATTTQQLGLLLNVRRMNDGRLLVNDGGQRQLLMFDSLLSRATVIADPAASTGLAYGNVASPIVAFPGDSTLFLDRASRGFIVLDPGGKQARVAALPKASDQLYIGNSRSFADPAGRLVYRGAGIPNPTPDTGQAVYVIRFADSAAIVRANFETRTVDTAARVKLPLTQENHNARQPTGPARQTVVTFGLFLHDDWTMLGDGTIAIVRAQDYHVDWVAMDGTRTSTAKMPFEWQRVDDDEKRRLADSAARETQEFIDRSRAAPPLPPRADGTVAPRTIAARADLITGVIRVMAIDATTAAAPLSRIPDYKQPFRVGSTAADATGNIWILPVTSKFSRGGGLVYDVVNGAGVLTERVELPLGRSIAAFGPGDIVYLMYKEGDTWRLEVRRILR